MANEEISECPFGKVAKKIKESQLTRFREDIVAASKKVRCPYPEYEEIRKKTNQLLKDIDQKIEDL